MRVSQMASNQINQQNVTKNAMARTGATPTNKTTKANTSDSARAKDYTYSNDTIEKYGSRTANQIINSKSEATVNKDYKQYATVDRDGHKGYYREYESGFKHWRPEYKHKDLTDDEINEIALKRSEEVLNRMARLGDDVGIGVPKDPIGDMKAGREPYGPDYVLPDLVGKSKDELVAYFTKTFTSFRDLEQRLDANSTEGELRFENRMREIEQERINNQPDFEKTRRENEESMRQAKIADQKLEAQLTQKLKTGQSLSIQEIMQLSSINPSKAAKAMQMMTGQKNAGNNSLVDMVNITKQQYQNKGTFLNLRV